MQPPTRDRLYSPWRARRFWTLSRIGIKRVGTKPKSWSWSGHFTKDCFGPDSTRSFFWSIGRIFAKIVGNLRALSSTTLYLRGKIWRARLSPPRVGYRKSDRLLFLNMLKNSSRSKTVGPWSSWSSEGPLKVLLSRAYFRILAPRKHVDRARNVRDSSPPPPPPWSIGRDSIGSKKGTIGGDSGRQSGRSKKLIHRGQSGPDRADWKKQSLVKCSLEDQDTWRFLYERPDVHVVVSEGFKSPANKLKWDSPLYNAMVNKRPAYINQRLQKWPNVLFSDVDTVWLSAPFQYLQGDFVIAVEEDQHRPYIAYCAGFVFFKATNNTREFVKGWLRRLHESNTSISDQVIMNWPRRHSRPWGRWSCLR